LLTRGSVAWQNQDAVVAASGIDVGLDDGSKATGERIAAGVLGVGAEEADEDDLALSELHARGSWSTAERQALTSV
jgi:hypothetical protein